MIAMLRGVLAEKQPDHIVLDVGGVGYRLFIALSTYETLPAVGEQVRMLTLTHVREDALHLYGFASQEERALFVLLNNVTGIGTRMAISALSTLSASALAGAIASEDLHTLCLIPGVGRKTAQRLVIELKDRLPARNMSTTPTESGQEGATGADQPSPQRAQQAVLREELTSALMNLGYKRPEVERALSKLFLAGQITSVGDGLRAALKALARPVAE
ncbi:MAG: Holliday junction branch migration protein RuvA [Magnetococcales bacterium]|nr:Holliday junction branch migration protein RuvA [Magnetococcales bacterium]MBF0583584.1 Holliday junction branch migration protein RuvA [Magnetococcales bacterium]